MRYCYLIILFYACNVDNFTYKCDYVSKNNVSGRSTYFSIIQTINHDIAYQDYYLALDSNFIIDSEIPDFVKTEYFTNSEYLLYGSIILRKDAKPGEYWKSVSESHDSMTVVLIKNQHIIKLSGKPFYCHVYQFNYDNIGLTRNFTNCIIYFNFEKKILFKKVYYNHSDNLGGEELLNITNI